MSTPKKWAEVRALIREDQAARLEEDARLHEAFRSWRANRAPDEKAIKALAPFLSSEIVLDLQAKVADGARRDREYKAFRREIKTAQLQRYNTIGRRLRICADAGIATSGPIGSEAHAFWMSDEGAALIRYYSGADK